MSQPCFLLLIFSAFKIIQVRKQNSHFPQFWGPYLVHFRLSCLGNNQFHTFGNSTEEIIIKFKFRLKEACPQNQKVFWPKDWRSRWTKTRTQFGLRNPVLKTTTTCHRVNQMRGRSGMSILKRFVILRFLGLQTQRFYLTKILIKNQVLMPRSENPFSRWISVILLPLGARGLVPSMVN